MRELILNQIYNLRWLILIYVAFILGISVLSFFIARNFTWNGRNTSIYGFLYNLTDKCKISYSISLTRMIFVFICAAFPRTMGLEAGIVLILSTIFVAAFSGDFRIFIGQLFIYSGIYGVLLLEGMFSSYFNEVEQYWLIKAMVIFLGVFASLYAVYQHIILHERLVVISTGDRNLRKSSSDLTLTILDLLEVFGIKKLKNGETLVDVQKET